MQNLINLILRSHSNKGFNSVSLLFQLNTCLLCGSFSNPRISSAIVVMNPHCLDYFHCKVFQTDIGNNSVNRQAVWDFFKPRRSVLIAWAMLALLAMILYIPYNGGNGWGLWAFFGTIWLISIITLIGLVMAFPHIIPFTLVPEGNTTIMLSSFVVNVIYYYPFACILGYVLRRTTTFVMRWFDEPNPHGYVKP